MVIIAHLCLAFYWALRSSLSENIRYGSVDDLFAVYRYYDAIDKRECDIMHEIFSDIVAGSGCSVDCPFGILIQKRLGTV